MLNRSNPKGEIAWDQRFQELQKFYKKNKHCLVKTKGDGEHKELGRWVSSQRSMYKRYHEREDLSNLTLDQVKTRIQALDKLGFVWNLGPSATTSSEASSKPPTEPIGKDNETKKRTAKNEPETNNANNADNANNANKKPRLVDSSDNKRVPAPTLARSNDNCTAAAASSSSNTSTACPSPAPSSSSQQEILTPQENEKKQWNYCYQELAKYVIMKGDCNVPLDHAPNPDLGAWVHEQRIVYHNNKNNQLVIGDERETTTKKHDDSGDDDGGAWPDQDEIERRISVLTKIGFDWDVSFSTEAGKK